MVFPLRTQAGSCFAIVGSSNEARIQDGRFESATMDCCIERCGEGKFCFVEDLKTSDLGLVLTRNEI